MSCANPQDQGKAYKNETAYSNSSHFIKPVKEP